MGCSSQHVLTNSDESSHQNEGWRSRNEHKLHNIVAKTRTAPDGQLLSVLLKLGLHDSGSETLQKIGGTTLYHLVNRFL